MTYLQILRKYIYYITALAYVLQLTVGAQDVSATESTTTTTTTAGGIDAALSTYPDGVLLIDGAQTSCMVALVNEAYGFVSAACLMPSGSTTAIAASRLTLAINGLQSSGQLSVNAAVVHPSYDATTLANNIGIVYFDINKGGKSDSGNSTSVAAAKCDITKTYLERRTLSSLSPLTWNTPPSIVAFTSNSDDVCSIGSPVYAANQDDFICNNAVASPGSGLSSCALPLGLGYTAITSVSALPSAVYSHSVVFGDGLCSNSKMVHYYVVLNNYLAWAAQVVQTLESSGVSAKADNTAAGFSMNSPSEVVPVIETYSGNLYTQVPVPMATPTPSSGGGSGGGSSSGSKSYTTFYITSTSCDTDNGGASPTSTPPPVSDGGSGMPSVGDTDCTDSITDCTDTDTDDDCTDTGNDCTDTDNQLSGIINIVTLSQSGSGNIYVPISISASSASGGADISASTMFGNTGTGTTSDSNTATSSNSNTGATGTGTGTGTDIDTDTNTDETGDGSDADSSSSDLSSGSDAEENGKSATGGISRTTAILIAVLVPLSVLAIFVCLYFYWRRRTHA
ncbi:hypothetical protein LPJ59_001505 [Coemansia sp. RSA 2399]|nr:hypothetical protein LPJ59_001505 [Coemansia sp. RSA 2399]KAJ1906756.1 hypothetical protein LPJ81_001171 [Coemansia sp. IMI 209127]